MTNTACNFQVKIYCFTRGTIFRVIAYRKAVYPVTNERSSLVVKIDKELHKQIKAACAVNDISIRDYIIGLIEKDMQKRNKQNKNE